jgi:sulfonate transport system permease protein
MSSMSSDRKDTRGRLFWSRYSKTIIGTASVSIFLVVWQLAGSTELVRSELVSYPTQIVAALYVMVVSGELGENIPTSLREFIEGLTAAIIGGFIVGLAFALSRRVRYLFEPLFVALYTAPMIVFVPVLVVWFGLGTLTKSAAILISASIPIVINTTTGILEASEPCIRALRAFGANKIQVVIKGIMPGALPTIMAGVRLAIGRAIVILIAGEMYVSTHGIGRLISNYSVAPHGAPQIFVLVGIVAVFGYLCIFILKTIERRLLPWRIDP